MKSNVSDHLIELLTHVYSDVCQQCPEIVSDKRDLLTIKSRAKHEGLQFLTITLPSFCRDFERSLDQGCISPDLFRAFSKKGPIPAFLQGMVEIMFSRETGLLTHHASDELASTVVGSVRQITNMFKRLDGVCSPQRTNAALDNYRSIEQELYEYNPSQDDVERFALVASHIWPSIIDTICINDLEGKHGPGSVFERLSPNEKFIWTQWNERLETYFPFLGFALPLGASSESEFEMVTFVSSEEESPVRVTPVPKTHKAPRIIAIEPVAMQYAQQSIKTALYKCIERSRITGGHVNFTDQTCNRLLALTSSATRENCTIDLKDASDRVPLSLAIRMFDSNPDLQEAILACRSTRALMPNGDVINLHKFASMGSALCFPVEAMYFYTICVMSLLESRKLPCDYKSIWLVSRDIFIYGDDIIVPNEDSGSVVLTLQKYNCKTNPAKTFSNGYFRESCGMDGYKGREVTPIYFKHASVDHGQLAQSVSALVSSTNLFYKKGFWNTARFLRSHVESHIGHLPYVSDTSGGLGWESFLGFRSVDRYNKNLHRFEVRTLVVKTVSEEDPVDSYHALGKSLKNVGNPDIPSDNLERSERRGVVSLKLRWVPIG